MAVFTQHTYRKLLQTLKEQKYSFQTFRDYLARPAKRSIILRHDVDKKPRNSLVLAKIEHDLGLRSTYNFRIKPCSLDEAIIKEIAQMGHEIGYHYEELSTCRGNQEEALKAFKLNLEKLRKLAPVSTTCMHGSPRSRYDSRDLWKTCNHKDLQLTGEPYFDMDFSKVLYLTDTGRRWDGEKVNIRDKVNRIQTQKLIEQGYPIHSTEDIIKAA